MLPLGVSSPLGYSLVPMAPPVETVGLEKQVVDEGRSDDAVLEQLGYTQGTPFNC